MSELGKERGLSLRHTWLGKELGGTSDAFHFENYSNEKFPRRDRDRFTGDCFIHG